MRKTRKTIRSNLTTISFELPLGRPNFKSREKDRLRLFKKKTGINDFKENQNTMKLLWKKQKWKQIMQEIEGE